jgi:uncharacterized membrane protein (UPF0127 family)
MKIKKYFLLVVILFIFIFAGFLFLTRFSLINSNQIAGLATIPFLQNQTKKGSVKIENQGIKVDIADNVTLQTKGLSGRSILNENEGMLFVFPDNKIRYFWMKDMLFPIDIIWITKEGKIVDIEKNAPKPEANTPDYKLPIYTSPEPVSYVLEVNAGFSERHNIAANDIVQINQ